MIQRVVSMVLFVLGVRRLSSFVQKRHLNLQILLISRSTISPLMETRAKTSGRKAQVYTDSKADNERLSALTTSSEINQDTQQALVDQHALKQALFPIRLLSLGRLQEGRLLARPSKSIKSPFVADVALQSATNGDAFQGSYLAHAPSLGCGGIVAPGSTVFCRNNSNQSSSSNLTDTATSDITTSAPAKKAKTTKTSHSIQLCVDERFSLSSFSSVSDYLTLINSNISRQREPVLVGYHPQLAEQLARTLLQHVIDSRDEEWLRALSLSPSFSSVSLSSQRTVGDSRVDFLLDVTLDDGGKEQTVMEVKNVVCAEYLSPEDVPPLSPLSTITEKKNGKSGQKKRGTALLHYSSYFSSPSPSIEDSPYELLSAPSLSTPSAVTSISAPSLFYRRIAIFPQGGDGNNNGFTFTHAGETQRLTTKTVSPRAIKHLCNLISLCSSTDKTDDKDNKQQTQTQTTVRLVVMFIVNRGDCDAFRPCHEADLLFAQLIVRAVRRGVRVVAVSVQWDVDPETGEASASCVSVLPVVVHRSVREQDIDEEHLKRVLSLVESEEYKTKNTVPTKKRTR